MEDLGEEKGYDNLEKGVITGSQPFTDSALVKLPSHSFNTPRGGDIRVAEPARNVAVWQLMDQIFLELFGKGGYTTNRHTILS